MEVKIIRSRRRKRTVSARLVKDLLVVSAPMFLHGEQLEKIVSKFKLKFERKRIKDELDKAQSLFDIASNINEKYFGNRLNIASIEYVIDQNSKFGCCDYNKGKIRISHKVGLMPQWVRDYVIIHELAHLLEPNHGKSFWDIVSRYKLAERARGYLMAIRLEKEGE
ncbi:MAG: M48 family metallopeptidase [Candidatus Omnitrophica bacterium]|nr:M48 family metallopeptidase [Candidatus Omnitrophota bacterium]MBU1869602.1 M48 family metallopeptidase [Candidatus Omnitrophota bacterium]